MRLFFVRSVVGALLLAQLGLVGSAAARPPDPALLADLEARAIGPAGPSGRVTAIDALPSDPDLIYVGTAGGGVWKSTNGGASFEPVFDDQPVGSIGAVAIDPRYPDIVWVGTGEGNPRNTVSAGNGVYKTLDGGTTWQHLGLEHSAHIHRLLLDPSDPQTAWVCALGPIWQDHPQRGVFKTSDGGSSWRQVLGLTEGVGCGDLVLDPKQPGHLLAALWQVRREPWFFTSGGPRSGLYLTRDGGDSWQRLGPSEGLPEGDLGRIGLAMAASDPRVVFALVEAEVSALLRSDDGGRHFVRVNDHPQVALRPFYFADLRVDPAQPDRLYSLDYTLKVSGDGGRSFTELPGVAQAALHEDHHALWINPADPRLMIDGGDGGVALSRDGGETFRFVANLPLAQAYHVAVDQERPYNVYGGLQDNGSWRGPSSVWRHSGIRSHHWREIGDGDGFDVAPDPDNPRQGYSMWQGGQLIRWNLDTGEMRSIRPPPGESEPLRFNWNAAFALDPFAPGTLYLGSQYFHRSRDRGETWQQLSPDLTQDDPDHQRQAESGGLTVDVSGAEGYASLVALAPSPITPGLLWAGSDDGRLHLSRDGGEHWASVEHNLPAAVPQGAWIPHIAPSPHHDATVFAVLDDHRRGDPRPYVVVTSDDGASWRLLPSDGVRGHAQVIAQDPVSPDLLFLGTELGLWLSNDGGEHWWPWRHGLPTVSVTDLIVHPRDHDLVIATHGRGFFVIDDIRPLRDLPAAEVAASPTAPMLRLYDIPPAQQYWPALATADYGYGVDVFEAPNRPYGALLSLWLDHPALPLPEPARRKTERRDQDTHGKTQAEAVADDGSPRLRLEIRDAQGVVLRTLHPQPHRGLLRVAWDLQREAFEQPPWGMVDWYAVTDGPEVPPGTYRVTAVLDLGPGDEQRAEAELEVLADPRSANTPQDWQRRWQTALRIGALNDRAVAAISTIERGCNDLAAVAERLRQRLHDGGERDPRVIARHPLIREGEALCRDLQRVDALLWISERRRGAPAETDVMSLLWLTHSYNLSSWAPPSPSQLAYVDQVEKRLDEVLAELAQVEQQLEAYRLRVVEAGLALLEP